MRVPSDVLEIVGRYRLKPLLSASLALWAFLLALPLFFMPPLSVAVAYTLAATGVASTVFLVFFFPAVLREIRIEWWAASNSVHDGVVDRRIGRVDQVLIGVAWLFFAAGLAGLVTGYPLAIFSFLISMAAAFAFYFYNASALLVLNAHSGEAANADLNAARVALELLQPRFAFHFSATDLNTPSHVMMWLDSLEGLGVPFFIIVRERKHLMSLAVLTRTPVVLASGPQLTGLLPASVTTIFYANNAAANFAMINGARHLQHVQLLHGDSDKPASFSPVSKIFSKLFVAGQMAIDRYERNNVPIPAEKFVIVGRPQVAKITTAESDRKDGPVTIAYLPTWIGYHEDAKFSSLHQAARIIDGIMSGDIPVRVVFKPHPMSHKDPASAQLLADIRAALSRPRANGSVGEYHTDAINPIDLYNMADLLISDISSVIIDFLYSGKPYIVTNPSNYDDRALQAYPSVLGGYLLSQNGDNALDLLKLATGADPMREKRMETRAYAFGDLDYPAGELFRQASLEIVLGQDAADAKAL